jgi:hypothetical protein
MPLFFWFPMIIMGGMLDVAADRATRSSGREGAVAEPRSRQAPRVEQRPMRPRRPYYKRSRGWPTRITRTMTATGQGSAEGAVDILK